MRYIIVLLVFVIAPLSAIGQSNTDFKIRYETFIKGDIKIIGNNILNRKEKRNSPNDPYNDRSQKAKLNDEFDMQYIDIDNDPNTFSSSSAQFAYDGKGGKIAYAALYWSATYPYAAGVLKGSKNTITDANRGDASTVLFKTPDGGGYTPISGELIYDGRNDETLKNSAPYAYYANVTNLLSSATKVEGEYTVANVKAALGQVEGGAAAGWALVLVYENPDSNIKKIITYDGFSAITNEASKTFTFSGFKTPEAGDFKTRIMGVTLEGDFNMAGDNVALGVPASGKTTSLESKLRPNQNFFSSAITHNDNFVTTRNPNSENTLGFDIFRLDVKNDNQYLIPNNANSLELSYTRSRDRYYLFLTALEIENNPKEITQLHRSTRVTKLTAKDTEKGYYVIVGVFLNINNVNNRVEEMKKWGYDAQVYYNRDQVLNFIYVARYDKYEDAVKKVDEIRENTEIPDPWILDVANYD
nr:adhesin [uncultured Capnocytophaga sp.]